MGKRKHDILTAIDFLILAGVMVCVAMWAVRTYLDSPPYVSSERYPVRGIDISAHNGMMNLDAAARDGVEFVFIKASEGKSFRDENFRLNHAKAQKANMKIGAYHYFRFDVDGVEQAKNLLAAIESYPLDLGVAIDVEEAGNASNVALEDISSRLQDMVDFLNLKGHRVIFYTNRMGYYRYLNEQFPGYPLWICGFNETPINAEWTFWQYDHHGKVSGIRGDVDLNAFAGSREEWEHYLATGVL